MNFREKLKVAYRIFGLIVVLLMIVLGLFLLFSDYFGYLQWNIRIAFALFLIALGTYRIVSMLVRLKRQKEENEAENN
ncbi:MAG: hypothetical protein JW973_09495 [Bacteroidales bacterium]|nr:hypothetical protein [Bacteroidales bacterium]